MNLKKFFHFPISDLFLKLRDYFSNLKNKQNNSTYIILAFFTIGFIFFGIKSIPNFLTLTVSSFALLYLIKFNKIKYNYLIFAFLVIFVLRDFRLFLFFNAIIGLSICISDYYISKLNNTDFLKNSPKIDINFQDRLVSGIMMVALLLTVIKSGGFILYCLSFLLGLLIFYEFIIMHVNYLLSSGRISFSNFLNFHQDFRKYLLLGLVYSSLISFSLISLVSYGLSGSLKILFVFSVVSASDIGGYIFGKIIKGPKIIPSISPNKTYSGFVGCIVFGVLSAKILFPILCYAIFGLNKVILIDNQIVLLLICILSQCGDILESKIKRICGVKDSSNLILGHGGFMDRFDGYVLVLPFVAIFI